MSDKGKIILTEEALEKLVCVGCNTYLVLGSIEKAEHKTIFTCGHCNKKNTLDTSFPIAAYLHYLIPCINCFDRNCKELLLSTDMQIHEKSCNKKNKTPHHNCTECNYQAKGVPLYHHFFREHPENALRYPFFRISTYKEGKFNLMYRKNNDLFTITCQVIPKAYVILTVEKLGICEGEIEFTFTLKASSSDNEKYKSKVFCFTPVTTKIDTFLPVSEITGAYERKLVCHFEINNPSYELFHIISNKTNLEKTNLVAKGVPKSKDYKLVNLDQEEQKMEKQQVKIKMSQVPIKEEVNLIDL